MEIQKEIRIIHSMDLNSLNSDIANAIRNGWNILGPVQTVGGCGYNIFFTATLVKY